MDHQYRDNNHTFRLNTAAVVAIVAVAFALVLWSYFSFRAKQEEVRGVVEAGKLLEKTMKEIDKIPMSPNSAPSAPATPQPNLSTSPQQQESVPDKLPPVTYP